MDHQQYVQQLCSRKLSCADSSDAAEEGWLDVFYVQLLKMEVIEVNRKDMQQIIQDFLHHDVESQDFLPHDASACQPATCGACGAGSSALASATGGTCGGRHSAEEYRGLSLRYTGGRCSVRR